MYPQGAPRLGSCHCYLPFKKARVLHLVGESGIMPLIISVDSASEKELLKLAKEYNLDISDYIKG
jgi:hypothetical protein